MSTDTVTAGTNTMDACTFPTLTDGRVLDSEASSPLKLAQVDLGDLTSAQDLRSFAAQHGVSLPSLFNAAWAIVIGRYLGIDMVSFVTLTSAEEHHNGAVCRADLNNDSQLCDILRAIDANTQRSFDVFRRSRVSALDATQSLSNSAVFFKAAGNNPLPAAAVEHVASRERFVALFVTESEPNVSVHISYSPALITESQAVNLSQSLTQSLCELVRRPQTPLGQASLVSQYHIDQMWRWNTHFPKYEQTLVHDLVDQQAILYPEAQAVSAHDGSLTYANIRDYSDRLAHHLITLGVRPGVIVPFCFEKSAWVVVAQLAISKAGGAMLAIDPKQPKFRTAEIIERVGASVMVTSRQNQSLWMGDMENIFALDADSIAQLPKQLGTPPSAVSPCDMLYLIFTSGSTGKPKGCVIEHRNFCSAVQAQAETVKVLSSTRMLQNTTYTFDVSMFEIYGTLTSGGCLCIPSDDELKLGLTAVINDYNVSFTFMTPSLSRFVDPADVPTLKTLVLGGEALTRAETKNWADHLCLINGYGPTECSVGALVNVGIGSATDPANIGRGLDCCTTWVVDANDHNQLVPIGAVGELLIQGPIVARGYYNDQQKTDEVFVENPTFLHGEYLASHRLYKTGDLVRYNSDGTIHFIGRKDTQVKVRGQRIELSEIDHHLATDSNIRNAAVLLPKSGPCAGNLVAAIDLAAYDPPPGADEPSNDVVLLPSESRPAADAVIVAVKERLSARVPVYMVPTFFVVLHYTPVTSSGKTNRKLLTSWLENLGKDVFAEIAGVETSAAPEQAATEMERQIQDVWAEVLHSSVSDVAVNRSFISLGGDSITAIQVSIRCRARGIAVTVPDILQSSTLREVAERAEFKASDDDSAAAADSAASAIASNTLLGSYDLGKLGLPADASLDATIEDVFGTSPMQQGILLAQARNHFAYRIRQIFRGSFPNGGSLDVEQLSKAWTRLVEYHASLRTVFVDDATEDGSFHQVVLTTETAQSLSPEVKHLVYPGFSVPADEDVLAFLKGQEQRIPKFGPQVALTICTLPAGFGGKVSPAFFCMLEINHALIDGGAYGTVLNDLATAYDNGLTKTYGPRYHDLISHVEAKPEDETMAYWQGYLADAQPCIVPVYGGESAGVPENRTVTVDFQKGSELMAFCREHNVTVANVLQAAWSLVLRTLTSSDDVMFGFITSGRDVPVQDIDKLVGICSNLTVVRLQMGNKSTLRELVQYMQTQYFASLEHQHLSLARLQSAINMAGMPLFNTILSLQRDVEGEVIEGASIAFNHTGDADPTDFDLAIGISVGEDNVSIQLGYWTNVTSEGEVTNVANTFSAAISAVMSSAESTAQEVTLFSERDSRRIWEWNREEPPALEGLVHEQISSIARRQPHAPAISSWEGDFTFAEVDDLSTRLAHHLISAGVKPGMKVPFCFNKSAWATITAIAIMKAGAAFVGTSPSDPPARLQSIIEDAGAKFVTAPMQHADVFEDIVERVIVVDPAFIIALPYPTKPLPKGTSNDLAYLSFTSGSTGKPKGIKVQHGSLLTSCFAVSAKVDFGPHTRILQFAAYAFDAHIAETIAVLTAGGCFCVPTDEERTKDPAAGMRRMSVNFTFLTPQVSKVLKPELVPTLETIVLGGEAVNIDCVRPWLGVAKVLIAYGPTETTICAAVSEPLSEGSDPLNLGYACGCRMWIAEAENPNNLVPIGAVGELLIEGRLVAEGYVNRDEQTKEVFIENPGFITSIMSPKEPARRFYRSGDLCRYNPDGSINYLGRKDTQVKVRGLRIELGEIEYAIMNYLGEEATSHVSVDAVELPKTGQTLVAFLHMAGTQGEELFQPMTPELRSTFDRLEKSLNDVLPGYMVPSLFVPLGYVPMGLTGKVDRKLLRKLLVDISDQQLAAYSLMDGPKVAPTSPIGLKLQTLWASVLKRDASSVGIHDSFFRLGGDSISAMHLSAAMRNAGLSLRMADIFRSPILKDMEALVEVMDEGLVSGDVEPFCLLPHNPDVPSLVRTAATACGVLPDDVEDIYPCTPLQEGIVAISSRLPGAYMMQNSFELAKNIDLTRFQNAWQQMVDASAIHRTRIVLTETMESIQVVLTPRPIDWIVVDVALDEYLVQDKAVATAYGQPLARYAIVRDNNSKSYFVWSANHSTYDGWSLPRMFDQVERIYRDEPGFPMVDLQFNKFIEFLNVHNGDAAAAFWKDQLKGDEPSTFPRLPDPSYQPQANSLIERTAKFEKRLNSSDVTMSTVIKAAWSLLLARYLDNADDVLFGQTLAGRDVPLPGVEEMQGPTITTVPVKVHINRESRVPEFLEAMQRQSTDMMPYEHYGLRNIRAVSGASAVDIKNLLVVHTASDANSDVKFIGMKPIENAQADFDTYALVMETSILDNGAGIFFHVAYDNRVLSDERAQRLVSHFEHVLQQLMAVPNVTLDKIDLFTEADESQIWQWNKDAFEVDSGCIHKDIERQAALMPDWIAVDAWDGQLTYAELDDLSSRLAHYFSSELGIAPEVLVPMCFDKSAWTVVTSVANLKAGGGCVMLNPDHPVARLQDIIEQTGGKVVLTGPQHTHLFDTMEERIVTIDKDFILSLPETHVSGVDVRPSTTAAVVFTSGSTGKPKGVVLEHRSIVTVSYQHCPVLGYRPGMRVLQFAHFTFDMSYAETFCVLMHGGTICIATEHDRVNNLGRVVSDMRVDWLLLTPTVAGLLDPKDCPDLQSLVLIGEAVDQACVDRWGPHVKLINSYGPSECTMWTSHAVSAPGVAAANIGRGFGGRLWIAEQDDHNRLTPLGCVGELLIDGPIVTRGYLNEPGKTAAVFIDNPPWLTKREPTVQHRVYKTGDLVKYCPDGTVLFLGRKDSQVKLHGQRLELGEIEHNVRILDEVETAMVILPKAGPCKGRLTTIMAFKEFDPPTIEAADIILIEEERKSRASELLSQVRSKISEKLPPYMVPTVWVVLGSIPVTPSRKINRTPIGAFIKDMSEDIYLGLIDGSDDESEMPTTEMETKLNETWSHILNLTPGQVGLTRSFVGLGGDSITAMQVVSRCRNEYGIDVSVKEILQSKGIASLAFQAKSGSNSALNVKEEFDTVFQLSPAQQFYFERIAAGEDTLPSSHQFNQSVLFRLTRTVNPADVQRAVHAIVERHSMLRALFTNVERVWMQKVRAEVEGSYDFTTYDVDNCGQLMQLIAAQQSSMDIENGPLFKVTLFNKNEEQHISLVAHHLIVDAVSWRVILENLEGLVQDPKSALNVASLPFQVWTKMQAERVSGLAVEKVLPYNIPTPGLDYWGLGSALNVYGDVFEETFTIDAETTSLLLGEANATYRTEPVELMLSSIFHSFDQTFAGRPRPTVFNEGHGREPWSPAVDVTNTVGWFTTFTPIHINTSSDNIAQIVRHVKDARRQIPANGSSYFASRYFNPEARDTFEHHGDMEIAFNYLGKTQQFEREDSLFREIEVTGFDALGNLGSNVRRLALFEISAAVRDDCLVFSVAFNRRIKSHSHIRSWIFRLQNSLAEAASELVGATNEFTLSDFPLLSTDYSNLKRLTDDMLPRLGVAKSNVENVYPCSPIQEGMLLSQARQAGSYLVRQVARVQSTTSEPVDVARLQAAWQSVVDRHPALRTIFLEQISLSDDSVHFHQLVLRSASANVKMLTYAGDDVVSFIEQEAGMPYDNSLPAHQVIFCQTSKNELYCLMELSHALIDGTSLALIQHDLVRAYQNSLPAGPGPLYSDYIAYLQSQDDEADLSYWTGYLANISACHFPRLDFPAERISKPSSLTIDLGVESALHSFCEKHEVTVANVFQAAWSLALRAYTGSDEVAFGYLASGRDIDLENIQSAVGPFINTLICRIDMDGLTPQNMLKKMSQDYLDALPFQHTSLAKIQRALGISGLSLFNTIISLQRLPTDTGAKPGLVFEVEEVVDPTEYDIVMQITTGATNVELDMTYWNNNMTDAQAKHVAATFRSAIAAIIATPEASVEELNLFAEEDRLQILEWNGFSTPPATETCLHWLIENQAAKYPQEQAICSWDAELTYAELSDLSNRLSHQLVSLGVGPEVLVPLCFEKSAWTLVTMVSVLKAGGCTVMLNPNDPQQRLERLVAETEASVMLTTPRFASKFMDSGILVIPVDSGFFYSLPKVSGMASRTVKPSNKAVVMFTSGSTGTPKGIVAEHRSLSTVAVQHAPKLGLVPGVRALQFAAYTWDVSTAENYFTLANGGCVCIPSDEERMNDIAGAINRTKANWTMITPTVSSLLNPVDVPTMKSVVLCGEPVPASEIEKWKHVDFYISYGPAECSVATTLSDRRSHPKIASSNIGHGIGARLWIANPTNHNILVPVGTIGELLIEGPIVTRGYLNNAEKTTEAYIVNPDWIKDVKATFNETTRLYKTGDLVRYNADGSLSIFGRKDTQVKISGQRTELSEIESQMRIALTREQMPFQAVVDVIKPVIRGEKKILAAFLHKTHSMDATVSADVSALSLDEEFEKSFKFLQTTLRRILPFYMVPTVFVPISLMPYTTSLKINRKILRNMGNNFTEEELSTFALTQVKDAESASPLNSNEKILAKLWAKALGFGESERVIDGEDSFFRLGGDSLAAMKLVSHARTANVSITVADIFKYPELSAMAQVLGKAIGDMTTAEEIKPFSLLAEEQTTLLEDAVSQCGISVSAIEDIYPTTPLQEGLMAISTRQPGAYVLQDIFKLPSSLDIQRFKKAWDKVVETHPILRTRIITTNAGAMQVVVKEGIEWNTSASASTYLAADKKTAIAYGSRLARYAILGTARTGFSFVWTAHHAIYDGFTQDGVYQQVQQIYSTGVMPSTTPYNRFIHYITKTVDAEDALKFWEGQFSSESISYPTLPGNSYKPQPTERMDYSISVSRSTGSTITTASILRAAWAIVTGRHADSQDVVFGLTLSGRNAPVAGIDEMMGPMITTLPLRIALDKSKTIAAFLADVQAQSVEMIPYEHTGLQNIKTASTAAREAVNFQNLLVIQPAMEDDVNSNDLGLERVPSDMADFDTYALVLECSMAKNTIDLQVQYDAEVLSTSHIHRMIHHLEFVFQQLAAEPEDITLGDISLFSPYDAQSLANWNGVVPEAIESTIHQRIEEQVRIRPDAMAVEGWDGSFTYRQLDELSTKLSHYLSYHGIGPDSKLPLAFPKSSWTVVAMLGALKAGAAVTLLNPDHPLSRLLNIFEDLEPAILLTDSSHVSYFEDHVPNVFAVNANTLKRLPNRKGPACTDVKPSDLAFVNYTSGTTGRPKGILIEHQSIVTSLVTYTKDIAYTPETRVLQYASYTFDVSISEILCALMNGATLCVLSEEERMNDIAGGINRYNINLADLTPTVAMLFTPEQVPTLKTLTVGGEALTRDAMNIWAGHVNLINAYGPAECSISTSWSTDLTLASDPSNIGKGKACRMWVVEPDDYNRLAPVGTIGELLVEGPIVARGYLNRANKTAEAFVSNPAWAVSENSSTVERRMYCTGDLVRYDADGNVRYVGRKDTQVKIHGQRVEVGEIEYNVAEAAKNYSHVGVEVVKIKARGDAKALVAFLAQESDEEDKTNTDTLSLLLSISTELQAEFLALQSELFNTMPAFMVPSMFVPMKRLPIHSSGKLDRKELQLMAGNFSLEELSGYSLTDAEVNSGKLTASEKKLQAVWAGVLRIGEEQIGSNNNFFRLGGDSIAAMKLAAELRTVGKPITVVNIYANPTLTQMAKALESSDGFEQEERVIEPFSLVAKAEVASFLAEAATQCSVTEELVEDMYPCTPLQEGLLTLSTRQETAYINRSVYRLPKLLDIARYKGAWEAIAIAHPILRTRIISTGTTSLQVVLKDGITWQSGASVEEYLEHDKTLSMTYGTPLARYAVIPPTAKDSSAYFVWTAHHSIYDGWSEATLFGHVEQYYKDESLPNGAAFNNFINYLTNEVNEEESDAFWRTQVIGDIPSSYPKLPSPTYEPTPLAVQQTTISFVRNAESNATLSTIIRAAWAAVLGRWSNSEDIVYGLTLAGRNAPVTGITDMVGPTITTVPVRVRLGVAMEQPIASFLEQIEAQATQMMPFEHAGLQKIRRLGESAAAVADFKNLLVLQPVLEGNEDGLGLVPANLENDGFDTFALVVECMLGENQVEIGMRYDESVISFTEISWLMGHFTTAIEHMNKASATERLNQLKMFSAEDKQQLKKWNPTYPSLPDMCVHDLVKARAREHPEQEAVHAWDAKLTYKQLDEMSTQLAYYLGTLGVAPKIIVPLCFDKSAWAIVAMLAVIKAGGACVSLNPEHPISRLQEIADDVNAQIIITAPQHVKLFEVSSQSVIPVGAGCSFPVMFMTPAEVVVSPEDPVFVVMTSGSTGKPKGVVLEHRAMSASMRAHGPTLEMQGRRVLQFAAYTFDISIAEMFTTLSYGGTVCVPSEEDRMNNLASVINDMNVDWACLTPTVANLIKPSDVPNLETLVLSGEAPTKANLMTWADSVMLINAYGPSECSIWSGINKGLQKTTSATNIGYGSGSQLWITEVDDPNRLVPLGCVGELLIDGPILAQGYYENPEKTSAAFIENPVWVQDFDGPREGRRMYRTGDLARYNVDGTIDYLGRKDAQSKLYGQRMEMGEIEYHIKKMRPDWLDIAAEVIALTNKKALVAFFMASEEVEFADKAENILQLTTEEQIELRSLQDNLLTVMPSHMVPSIWVPVRELPKTTSGKLDRKTLRTFLKDTSTDEIEQYSLSNVTKRAPETDAEKTLASLWAKALGIPESTVGIDDTFFRLGGDSIIAMRLVSIARAQGISLTVANIFRQPRLADLAALVLDGHSSTDETSAVTQIVNVPGLNDVNHDDFLEDVVFTKTGVEKENIQAVLPTTDFQGLALTGGLTEARWMLNYFFFESDNEVDLDRVEKAFQETVDHNEILRTVFILHNAKFLQVVLKKMEAEFSIYETEQDLDVFTKNLVQASKSQPLPLEESLTRFYVIKDANSNRHRVMMRISHAQYDGVSLPYIWNSYKNAYEGAAQDEMTGFTSFMSDYMSMQTEEGFDYWRNLLAGSSMTDIVSRTGPNVRKNADKSISINRKIPYTPLNKQGITFATMLKSAWAIILSQISGHSDVVFGHTISGRSSGAADVVGPCLNAIPVRVPIKSGWTLIDLMNFVQEQQLANIPYENVGSREIIKRCTDWAEYGYFNSVVQHQNIDPEEDIVIDGHAYQPGWIGEELDLVDIGILSMPLGDEIEVNMMFTPTVVPESLANELLSMLCNTLVQLSANPHDTIPSSPFDHPIIPLALSSPSDSLEYVVEGAQTPASGIDSFYGQPFSPAPFSITSAPFSPFSPPLSSGEFGSSGASTTTDFSVTLPDDKQLVRAGVTLDTAWRTILANDSRKAPALPNFTHTSSFFQMGGDMISATKLALVLREEGYLVTPENIVFNPTFEGQMNMLAAMERIF